MPSPPPPYSPETPDPTATPARASPMVENVPYTASPVHVQSAVRQSPQVGMSAAFPPPPGTSSRNRDRSASSNQRSFFNLAGLRGKQPANVEPQGSSTFQGMENIEPRPPAARRAASTGHMQSTAAIVAQTQLQEAGAVRRGSPESSWQPGMPLPGPPPGAPPPGARSQSLNRYAPSSRSNSISSERSLDAPPPQRRTAAAGSNLGPIPPTPADWVDTDSSQPQQVIPNQPMSTEPDADYRPLRIDTGSTQDNTLSRRPARRDGSAQGIRERRSRSRADRSSRIFSPDDENKPSDLVFATTGGAISRRREHMRTISSAVDPNIESSSGSSGATRKPAAPTANTANTVLTPPYTPAVGNRSSDDLSRRQKMPGSATSDRPISQVLQQPMDDSSAIPASLTPSRPPSSGSAKPSAKLDSFAVQAIERHRAFIEKEMKAGSDEERLELFANFLVHESRLRRDRYATAYNAMAGDIVDLTRDMWRSYTKQGKRAATPSTSMSSFDPTLPSWASDGQPTSAQGNMPSSASSYGDYTPGTDANSLNEFETGMERSDSRQWGEQFKPSLSPIPSMAVSTVPDEDSSRGRQPSRWWEQSNSGSGSIGKPDRIQKSLRETKYMGINPAMLRDIDQPSPQSSRHTGSTPGPSTQSFAYGPNEYPPEKVGWHEDANFETPVPTPAHVRRKSSNLGGLPLDVSRLVTLPPPYPRHHPAVNNNHPQLDDLRGWHRELADRTRIQEIRDAYLDKDNAVQQEQQEAAKQRKARLRLSIQGKISDGSISFAEAAQAEADFDIGEADRGKAIAKSNFDLFETSLAQPLNALLTERLERADRCISQLRAELQSRNESSDPNQAQEEGDEEPERLEKLTLLKWIFEAREQLHKEMFDFHADRAAKYSEVILTPYRIAKLQAKIDDATAFFAKDSQDRQTSFAKDVVKRYEELQGIMELNVSRGVEDQLSAFWDIAPGLLEVIQHLPTDLNGLDVQIPEMEYDENPAYHDHPLQYLYSLLSHAQKSAYQFIESQTNLLCLLHEVRTATAKASLKVLEVERQKANPDDAGVVSEMEGAMVVQEERLTEDLKDKVGEVERQWKEALGEGLEDCKDRVRDFLEENGGWEDGLEG